MSLHLPEGYERTVLYVEDEEDFSDILKAQLKAEGFRVIHVRDSRSLYEVIGGLFVGVVLLDLKLNDVFGHFSRIAGVEILKRLRHGGYHWTSRTIVLSGYGDPEIRAEAEELKVFGFHDKAEIDRKPLFDSVRAAFDDLESALFSSPTVTFGPPHFSLRPEPANETDEDETPAASELHGHAIEVSCALPFEVIPTGISNLLTCLPAPEGLVAYTVTNHTEDRIDITLETEIRQWAELAVSAVQLPPRASARVFCSPLFDLARAREIREVQDATLAHTVSWVRRGRRSPPLRLETLRVRLLPITTMCWRIEDRILEQVHDLAPLLGAWVTPNARQVQGVLRRALADDPGIRDYRQLLDREGREALNRHHAHRIYDALRRGYEIKHLELAQVVYPVQDGDAYQRIRLPEQTLTDRAGNCIDCSVLFASLLEGAGLGAVVLLIPGHALVGWETYDGSGEFEYLEMTMPEATFDKAHRQGMAVARNAMNGSSKASEVVAIPIATSRREGILPMNTRW